MCAHWKTCQTATVTIITIIIVITIITIFLLLLLFITIITGFTKFFAEMDLREWFLGCTRFGDWGRIRMRLESRGLQEVSGRQCESLGGWLKDLAQWALGFWGLGFRV